MKRLSIPEVLKSLKGKSQEEKIKILRSNDSRALRSLLFIAFSKKVEVNLPNERPEEIKSEEIPPSNLYLESRKLRIFLKGTGYDHLKEIKRQTIFINILESISVDESELLLQILIDKKLKSDIEYDDVRLSFEGLLSEIKKEEKPKKKEKPVEKIPEPVVEKVEEVKEDSKEEKEVYKNLTEVYEKNKPKKENSKKSKNKKSSKKKSK